MCWEKFTVLLLFILVVFFIFQIFIINLSANLQIAPTTGIYQKPAVFHSSSGNSHLMPKSLSSHTFRVKHMQICNDISFAQARQGEQFLRSLREKEMLKAESEQLATEIVQVQIARLDNQCAGVCVCAH